MSVRSRAMTPDGAAPQRQRAVVPAPALGAVSPTRPGARRSSRARPSADIPQQPHELSAWEHHPGMRVDGPRLASAPESKYFKRTSDEIRARQRADLAKALVFGPYDDARAVAKAEGVIEEVYPGRDVNDREWMDDELYAGKGKRTGGRRAGGVTLPVTRLDTSDMMRFLAERRAQDSIRSHSTGDVTGSPGDSSRMGSGVSGVTGKLESVPETEPDCQLETKRWWRMRRNRFRRCAVVGALLTVILMAIVMGAVFLLFHVIVQANVNGLRIQWSHLELSDVTTDSFKLEATGLLEGTKGMSGMILESTEVTMAPQSDAEPFARLRLPRVICGEDAQPIHISETVLIHARRSLVRWANSLTSIDVPSSLQLRGNARVSLASGSIGTAVELKPLPTQIAQGMISRMTYPPQVEVALMPETPNEQRSMSFEFQLNMTNGGPVGVKDLGTTSFEVYKDNDVVALARLEKSPYSIGTNAWRMRGHFTKPSGQYNQYLTDVIHQRADKATFVGTTSTLEGRQVDYLTALVSGITLDVALRPAHRPETNLRIVRMKAAKSSSFRASKLDVDMEIEANAALPMMQQQPLSGIRFLSLEIRNAADVILAVLSSADDTVRPLTLGTAPRSVATAHWRLALDVIDEIGLHNLTTGVLMKVSGNAQGELPTHAGVVKVDFLLSQDINLHGPQ